MSPVHVLARLRQRHKQIRNTGKHCGSWRGFERAPFHVSSQQKETACAAVEQAVSVVDVAHEQQQRGVLEHILEENAQLTSSSESEGDSDEDEVV